MLVVPPVGLMRPKGLAAPAAPLAIGGSIAFRDPNSTAFSGQRNVIEDAGMGNGVGLGLIGDITYECWFKHRRRYLSSNNILMEYSGDSSYGYGIRLSSSGLALSWTSVGSTRKEYIAAMTWSYGTWYHVAATRNLATGLVSLYQDGTLLGSSVVEAGVPVTTGTAASDGTIMYFGDGFGSWQYEGKLAECRMWNYVRTQEEIAASRLYTLSGTEPGLAMYQRFVDVDLIDDVNGYTITQTSYDGNVSISTLGADHPAGFNL